jgi:ZIP family zinc transporter
MTEFLPFLLSLLAGLSTTIGSLIVFLINKRKMSFNFLCVSFGFSAGVMIFISFAELLAQGIKSTSLLIGTMGFFAGVVIIFVIDLLIPHIYEKEEYKKSKRSGLKRTAILITLGIAIHNFPEGMAVMFSTISQIKLGILMAIAIALHNIPEGIAVSLPIFYSTKNRKKAFYYSFLSGISEPIGAALGFFFLYNFLNEFVLGFILSAVAGIMVFISFDELLPYVYENRGSKSQHLSILGMFIGMFVISLTMIALNA